MRLNQNACMALGCVALAVFFLLAIPGEIRMLVSYAGELSPRFFPYLCAVCFLVFSLVIVWNSLHTPRDEPEAFIPGEMRFTLTAMGIVGVCCFLARPFGLVPSTTLMLLGLSFHLGARRPAIFAGLLAAWPLFLYLLFDIAFSTPLPRGEIFSW